MHHLESFKIGLAELRSNKLKTSLTMLGIIFGVASVIAMLSIGEGARQESLEQIELLGTNNIIITAKPVADDIKNEKTSFSNGLTVKDAESIKKIVPYVKSYTLHKELNFTITYKSKQQKMKVVGVTETYNEIYNVKIQTGTFIKLNHLENYGNVCVIGNDVKNEYFRFENPVDKMIKIDESWFRIIGVTESKKNSTAIQELGEQSFNNEIYVPLTTMNNKLELVEKKSSLPDGIVIYGLNDGEENIDRSAIHKITVKIKDDAFIGPAAEMITRVLERKHYQTKDYEVIVPEAIIEQKQKTQKIFNIVMGAIAGISLLVGGIGIMNIMLATILERTKEIGIRRAVGATRNDVLMQFLYEAIIISFTGGIIGIIIGYLLTSLITTYAEWRTIITPVSVLLAFIVALATGVGFGSYPAKKAAEKDPIESLRYE